VIFRRETSHDWRDFPSGSDHVLRRIHLKYGVGGAATELVDPLPQSIHLKSGVGEGAVKSIDPTEFI
jgi:hypothetical protein